MKFTFLDSITYSLNAAADSIMTYENFKSEYERILTLLLKYSPEQAGSVIYADELADLTDRHPEWAERYDSEA